LAEKAEGKWGDTAGLKEKKTDGKERRNKRKSLAVGLRMRATTATDF